MARYFNDYIRHCHACQVNKPTAQKPAGLLQPLPIPDWLWSSVSMNLVTSLPVTANSNDCVLVVVARLTKMCCIAACKTTITAPQAAKLLLDICYKTHGVPAQIVSDLDPHFPSMFWDFLFGCIGTKLSMSIAYHPLTRLAARQSGRSTPSNKCCASMSIRRWTTATSSCPMWSCPQQLLGEVHSADAVLRQLRAAPPHCLCPSRPPALRS